MIQNMSAENAVKCQIMRIIAAGNVGWQVKNKRKNIMGKMKEVWMEMLQNEYKGDYDAYLEDLARQTCEEFIPMDETRCPNCFGRTLHQNESDIICDACRQSFVQVENALRFK